MSPRAGRAARAACAMVTGLLVAGVVFSVPRAMAAQQTGASATARVTYVSGTAVYLDAGARAGLVDGSEVEVVRTGIVIARLRVTFLSPSRASCEIIGTTGQVAVGDTVRFVVRAHPAPAEDALRADSIAPPAGGRSWWRTGALHGRVGARYLLVAQRDSGTGRLAQPAAELRLHGSSLGGQPVSVDIDARVRRTRRTLVDGSSASTGRPAVYHAALGWNAGGPGPSVTVGRQHAAALGNVSLFDGVSAELNRRHWSVGAFAGTQPEPLDMHFSSEVREVGAFVQRHGDVGSSQRWSLTGGAIGAYARGGIDRELLFAQASFTGPRLSTFVIQEVDVNRGWKRDAGEPGLSITSTLATVHWRASPALTLHAGIDNRRSVRLYRDRETPETEFDDDFRRGAWGGASLRLARVYHVSIDGRATGGGSAGDATAITATLGASRMAALPISARARSTRFTSATSEGWLHTIALGGSLGERLYLELNAGTRDRRSRGGAATPEPASASRVSWFGGDVELSIARSWFALVSATRERGGWDATDQVYASIGWRF